MGDSGAYGRVRRIPQNGPSGPETSRNHHVEPGCHQLYGTVVGGREAAGPLVIVLGPAHEEVPREGRVPDHVVTCSQPQEARPSNALHPFLEF